MRLRLGSNSSRLLSFLTCLLLFIPTPSEQREHVKEIPTRTDEPDETQLRSIQHLANGRERTAQKKIPTSRARQKRTNKEKER